jgi:hypothetical protein
MNELIEYQKAQITLQRAQAEVLIEFAKAIAALTSSKLDQSKLRLPGT